MSLEPHAVDEVIAETQAALDEKAKLKKHFGRFDMLFFLICTLVGVDTLGAVASNGPEGFTWLIVLAVLFFVPYALLTAELGAAFTDEGGCYVWTKLAWGRFVASINSVLYWLSNPVWMGGLLCITAVTTFNTFFGDLGNVGQYLFSLAFIWFGVWAAILSFGVGKWIPTLGAWARIVLLAFFTFSVIIYAFKHGLHSPALSEFSPSYTLFIGLVPLLFFNFVGFELPSAAGDEMKDPQKDVPFTVLRSAVTAVVLYGVPILAIIMVLPADQITGLGGFIDAMKTVFTVYGGEVTKNGAELSGFGSVLGNLTAAMFILVLLSSGTTWLMGSDRSQAVAGYDGGGPRVLGTFSARWGTPIVVNFLSGTVSTIVMVLAFQLSGGDAEKYFNAVLNVVLLFTTVSYLAIFPALIKLRYSHGHVYRPYKVPFGMAGVWICGVLTTFWALFASLVGFFPGLGDGSLLNDSALPDGFSRGTFELVVFIPFAITLLIGIGFYIAGRGTRARLAPTAPPSLPPNIQPVG
ncbi:APC family permease [Solirubrobacter soli]|uniref:APC family permease n=1 Tax=Solirubrobacter soli TaxID=363832 RepID=UPI000400C45E|nr:APC family permease [Solirubrobacter soli]